jgi:hypothetical protein
MELIHLHGACFIYIYTNMVVVCNALRSSEVMLRIGIFIQALKEHRSVVL